ncbi:unnamed protein product [Orchesella dallaii]|uniref:Uncharacterized protein n=1 Tax=Orchesella dallaii TaxID=48710 RepID=A0ABP1PNV6_9HEXA
MAENKRENFSSENSTNAGDGPEQMSDVFSQLKVTAHHSTVKASNDFHCLDSHTSLSVENNGGQSKLEDLHKNADNYPSSSNTDEETGHDSRKLSSLSEIDAYDDWPIRTTERNASLKKALKFSALHNALGPKIMKGLQRNLKGASNYC